MREKKVGIMVGDIVLAVLILASAALVFLHYNLSGSSASSISVKSESGTERYSLDFDREINVTSAGHTLTVEIKDGEACVKASDCPDKVCVNSSSIGKKGGSIVCVPARVEIKVEGGEDDVIDWTAP